MTSIIIIIIIIIIIPIAAKTFTKFTNHIRI